jgi:glycosyltransferase involved in cell wall biosynthesis
MPKIGFLYFGNPIDNKYWSGTIHAMHDAIKSIPGIELVDLIVEPPKSSKVIYKMTRFLSLKKNVLSHFMATVNAKRVNDIVENSDCDIIFAPAVSKLVYAGRKSLAKKKLIYLSDATYHRMAGYYYDHSVHDQKIGNKWESTSLRMAKVVILASEWARDDAFDFYNIDSDKVKVLFFGSNMKDVGYKVVTGDKDVYNLLLVGVDWKRKGIDTAIECVKLLNEEGGSIKYNLTIIGVTPKSNNYPEYIKFVGRLNKNDPNDYSKLESYYKENDIFILPTRAECAGIVFTEAAMFGLPVFSCATGGVKNYVEDKVTGRCLGIDSSGKDFKDAIEEAIIQDKIKIYSQNARKKYENDLNWDVWADKFQQIVNEVMLGTK